MAGMYPDNQELEIFGEKVEWPGVDSQGKFTNGSFSDPMVKPSFIPAQTINLLLDNLSGLITKAGGHPDSVSINQLAQAFTSAAVANKGLMRDKAGRAKVSAPVESDDIARKKEVEDAITHINNKAAKNIPLAASIVSGAAGSVGTSELYALEDHSHPSEIFAYNFGTNAGYIKWRNGLIVQWGTRYGSRFEVTLPLSFSSFFCRIGAVSGFFQARNIAVSKVSLSKILVESFLDRTYEPSAITWVVFGI